MSQYYQQNQHQNQPKTSNAKSKLEKLPSDLSTLSEADQLNYILKLSQEAHEKEMEKLELRRRSSQFLRENNIDVSDDDELQIMNIDVNNNKNKVSSLIPKEFDHLFIDNNSNSNKTNNINVNPRKRKRKNNLQDSLIIDEISPRKKQVNH